MYTIDQIKQIFNDSNYKLTGNGIKSFLNKNKELCEYILHNFDMFIYTSPSNVIYSIIKNIDVTLYTCKHCQKQLTFNQIKLGNKYCSCSCRNNDKDWKLLYEQTCMLKYNVSNPSKSKIIRNKAEQTNLKNYGVDNVFKNSHIQKQIKQTNIEKYGVDTCLKLATTREKLKQTNIEKYGVEYPFLSDKYKMDFINTSRKKYGVDYPIQSNIIQDKIKKQNIEKYGVEYITQYQPHIDKITIKNKTRYYNNLKNKFKDILIPLFELNEFIKNKIMYFKFKWQCVKCDHIFYDTYANGHIPRCPKCHPHNYKHSNIEKELSDYIKSIYTDEIIENDKTLIHPYELDIVIPEKKIAIEFDGLYWHSDLYKQSNYHLMKTEMCEQQGYKLIHIFEDEWINKQEIIKNKLKSILGIDQISIYARKCHIKEIDNTIKNQFLNQNHIQGEDKSSIKLGLYYGDLLVAVMTFGKSRFNKNYQYELIRYATLNGYRVIGGAGKLLKYFERTYNPNSIITYADRRYSQGNMYLKLGFMFSHNSKPNLFYIKGNDIRFNRIKFQKHKLKNILGDKFDNNLSEQKNMKLNGWNKIYDCGNMVFIKIKGFDYE